jgi:hypothetical protein
MNHEPTAARKTCSSHLPTVRIPVTAQSEDSEFNVGPIQTIADV